MTLDPQAVYALALTCGVGYLMVLCGVGKNQIEWRRPPAICPMCRRRRPCGC